MKHTITFILFLIPVLLFSQISGQLNMSRDQLIFSKDGGFDKVSYKQSYIADIGMPQLPVIYRSYVVPLEASDFIIQIQSEKKEILQGDYLIYPVQPPQPVSIRELSEFVKPDSAIYNSSIPFPKNQASIISNKIIQGYRVITLALYPLEYIPKQRILAFRQISYNINYTLGTSSAENSPKISFRRANLAKTFVKSMVYNPEWVDLYTDYASIILETTNLNKLPDNPIQRTVNVMEQTVPDFVIITNNELKSAFQKLADWKTKKGIPTIIQTVEEIENKYCGSDLVEKIKSYLDDVRRRWNENALSILLGGDTEIIPTRLVKSNASKITSLQCTDACYSSSGFKWYPKDFRCDKEGVTISSYLGRLPVKNISEANLLINKILRYEMSAQPGIDYSYYNNFLIASAFMKDSSNLLISGHMLDFDNYRKQYFHPSTNYWYLFDHFGCKKNDHISSQNGYDTTRGEELNKANLISALEKGKNFGRFHFIFHEDHCETSSFGASITDKGQQIINDDIDNMANSPYYQYHYV